jgi:hypothetical protein
MDTIKIHMNNVARNDCHAIGIALLKLTILRELWEILLEEEGIDVRRRKMVALQSMPWTGSLDCFNDG